MSAIPWDTEEEMKDLSRHFNFASEEDLTTFKANLAATIPDVVPVGWNCKLLIQLTIKKDVSEP